MVISSEDEEDEGDKFIALLLLRQLVLLILIFAFVSCLHFAAIDIHYSNDLAGVWARLQEVFQVDQL